jgi:hypothetical protein
MTERHLTILLDAIAAAAGTGDEVRAMLEANLERTYSPDPYCQMVARLAP